MGRGRRKTEECETVTWKWHSSSLHAALHCATAHQDYDDHKLLVDHLPKVVVHPQSKGAEQGGVKQRHGGAGHVSNLKE